MRTSDVWRRIIGYQVGDFLSYFYSPSFRGRKGVWLNLRITRISSEYVFVKVISPKKYLAYSPFALRLGYVESNYPTYVRSYHPRKSTVKRIEG